MPLEHTLAADLMPERVVVMGANGFVGATLMAALQAAGIDALPLGRADVDLLAPGAADALAKHLRPADAFVAVSALAPVKNAQMLEQNIVIARAIADALTQAPVAHVVNIGSDAVYGDSSHPMTEASPKAPDSLHGVMHLARELVLREAVKSAPLALLRPSLLYGAADPHNGYGPNRFRRLAAAGEDIVLFGEGEERRDHVYVGDVAALCVRVLMRRSRGALNVATGKVRSFREIAEDVVSVAGSSSRVVGSPRVGPMPHNGYRAFGIAACRAAFPDFSYVSLEEGLRMAAGVASG